jgi:hypothetical protein
MTIVRKYSKCYTNELCEQVLAYLYRLECLYLHGKEPSPVRTSSLAILETPRKSFPGRIVLEEMHGKEEVLDF